MFSSRALALLSLAACAPALASCGRTALHEITGRTMGTTYTVKFLASGRGAAFAAQAPAAIDAALAAINRGMSTYDPSSALSRFNALATTAPVSMPADVLAVFDLARQVSDLSGGAFDVTVAPLVNAYGFGPGKRPARPPTEAEIRALRERVDYRMLTIDVGAGVLAKGRPDIQCDLGAIAQGWGVDKVAEALEAGGIRDYMVEIGGEVRARGVNAEGRPWQIGIERPLDDARALQRVVPLADMALSTSGDYRNFYIRDGKRLSHAIDPRTGRPIEHNLASVSVFHETCALADALATALNVLGPVEGFDLAEREGLAALFIVRQTDGSFFEKPTREFRRRFDADSSPDAPPQP